MVLQFSLFKRFRNVANKCKIFEFCRQSCSSDLICQLNFRSSTFTFLQGLCKIMSLHFHVIFGIRFFSVKKTLKSFARLHIKHALVMALGIQLSTLCIDVGLMQSNLSHAQVLHGLMHSYSIGLMHRCWPHAWLRTSCRVIVLMHAIRCWPHAKVQALCTGVGLMQSYWSHEQLLSSCIAQVLASCIGVGLVHCNCPHEQAQVQPFCIGVQALCIAIILMHSYWSHA